MISSDLRRRLGVAAVGVPVTLLCLYHGSWAFGGLVALVGAIATREFYGLAEARGLRPFTWMGTASSITVILIATALPTPTEAGSWILVLLVGLVLLSLAACVWTRGPDGHPIEAVSVTVFGVLYVGCTLAFLPMLRWLPATAPGALTGNQWDAAAFALLPIAATWIGDSVAFFVGKSYGRIPIAPGVSPNKTVLGSVGGLAGSVIGAVGVSLWALNDLPFLTVSPATAAVVGIGVGVAAQVGDLGESLLKRQAGLKDSGTILPGHGGFLDRLDALFFALPVTWGLLVLLGVL